MNGRAYEEKVVCTCGGDHGEESDEEEIAYDHPSYHRGHSPSESLQQRRMLDGQRAAGKPPPPASTASSADGYESFENTSNKKKRKIPLSGSSGVHPSSLTAELANMGISSHGTDGANDEAPPYSYPSPSTGMGHAGAGRGRASKASPIRRRDMRSAIPSPHTNGHAANVEQTVERGGAYKGDGTKITHQPQQSHQPHQALQEHKIISNAIANAQSQPTTPIKGKENVSLLSQSSPKSITPKTQFTFTCESDSSNKVVWPGQGATAHQASPTPSQHHQQYTVAGASRPQTTQGTQTTPNMPRGGVPAAHSPPHAQQQQQQQHPNGQSAPPLAAVQQHGQQQQQPAPEQRQRKPRRRPSREFELAARQRRIQQEYTNFHHKPTKSNIYICEFCEYEDIFGKPPMALIRQYEIKDRAERKKAEEKRRLLEKAKMKGRKGKKNGGKKQMAAPSGNGTRPKDGYDPEHSQDGQHYNQHGGHEDYYDDDGYDDGYDPGSPDEGGGPGSATAGAANQPAGDTTTNAQEYRHPKAPQPPHSYRSNPPISG